MAVTFRIRRDTAANWTAENPVLGLGEPGLERDTRRVKYGDGATPWRDLQYSGGSARAFLKATRFSGGGFQAIGAGAFVDIPLTDVMAGSTIPYDTATGLATIAEAGVYSVSATVRLIDNSALGICFGAGANKPGVYDSPDFLFSTTVDSTQGDAVDRAGVHVTALQRFAAGDKVRLYAWANGAIFVSWGSLSISRAD